MYADGSTFHEPATDFPERISSLQALLEGAPPLPDCKLLWHHALEGLVDGTRNGSKHTLGDRDRRLKPMAELHTRIEELETLKNHMQAVGMSITNAVSERT